MLDKVSISNVALFNRSIFNAHFNDFYKIHRPYWKKTNFTAKRQKNHRLKYIRDVTQKLADG